jgi:hypothetical protein
MSPEPNEETDPSAAPSKAATRSEAAGGSEPAATSKAGGKRRPGRPKGSGSFPAEKAEMVIGLIRSGSTRLRDACSSADLAYSTVRGWIKRAREDPACPRKVREFVRRLEQASSDSNIIVDRSLFQSGSAAWKKIKEAESLLSRDDDREPPADPDEAMRLFDEIVWRRAYLDPSFVIPRCPNARCRCMWHHGRTEEELEATRELARRKEEGDEGSHS